MKAFAVTLSSLALSLASSAFAGESAKKSVAPLDPESRHPRRFSLSSPGWLAGLEGDIGIGGVTSPVDVEGGSNHRRTGAALAAGCRALGVDYEGDGLTYDMITHGAQITLGIQF